MKKNIGSLDKSIRIVIVLTIASILYFDLTHGILTYILITIASLLLITSVISYCPVYKLLGINTKSISF